MNAVVQRYNGAARAIHWVSAALIIGLVVVGWYMSELPKDDPSRGSIYGLHKSVGVLGLLLLAARLVWLRLHPAPELPAALTENEKRLTKAIKSVLYLLMLLVPVSGCIMSQAAGHPVGFFGLFELPTLVGENKDLAGFAHETHELTAWGILALVALHMAGAVKHRLLDKNGETDVLARML